MAKPLIVDFGTVSIRIGHVGDKLPSFIFPPVFGQPLLQNRQNEVCDFAGGNDANWLEYAVFPLNPREKHDNTAPVPAILYGNGGYKIEYKAMDKLLECATGSKRPEENLEGSTVIASEPNIHTPDFRRTLAEVLVEGQRVAKFYLCKRAPLTCYASGRTSAIVVDVGGACSNVAAVSEGFVIQEATCEEPMGGSLMDRILLGYLNNAGTTIRPSFEYAKTSKTDENPKVKVQKTNDDNRKTNLRKLPFVHENYYTYAQLYATSRVKETCCVMIDELNIATEQNDSCFALPDGSYINTDVGKELCGVFCRCLFNDTSYLQNVQRFQELEAQILPKSPFEAKEETLASILPKTRGLDEILAQSYAAVSQMETNARVPDTLNTIILSGGTTRHPAVLPLLQQRFSKRFPDGRQPLFMGIGGPEQQYSSFIGASILASMGIFDTLCVSRSECQEHGIERILHRKCP
ncbi:putative actin-related protein [Babesia divergens]|uniref:Actin-related protein n=1 Tax=Babesia divergens TaxID=32595 RepID=A0AAD9GAE1_BABDI|nr:putative actin-related protein [Babesia divergens]